MSILKCGQFEMWVIWNVGNFEMFVLEIVGNIVSKIEYQIILKNWMKLYQFSFPNETKTLPKLFEKVGSQPNVVTKNTTKLYLLIDFNCSETLYQGFISICIWRWLYFKIWSNEGYQMGRSYHVIMEWHTKVSNGTSQGIKLWVCIIITT